MPTHTTLSEVEYCDQFFLSTSSAVFSSSRQAAVLRPAPTEPRAAASQLGPTFNFGGPAGAAMEAVSSIAENAADKSVWRLSWRINANRSWPARPTEHPPSTASRLSELWSIFDICILRTRTTLTRYSAGSRPAPTFALPARERTMFD